MPTLTLTPHAAKVLATLVADGEALSRARDSADALPDPDDTALAELADELGRPDDAGTDNALGDLADEPVTEAELAGPGAPTMRERKLARYSRDSERIRYARSGQGALQFSRRQVTDRESEIAIEMVRRQPGLSFDKAVAMLRR